MHSGSSPENKPERERGTQLKDVTGEQKGGGVKCRCVCVCGAADLGIRRRR